jgi:hypothetical protein
MRNGSSSNACCAAGVSKIYLLCFPYNELQHLDNFNEIPLSSTLILHVYLYIFLVTDWCAVLYSLFSNTVVVLTCKWCVSAFVVAGLPLLAAAITLIIDAVRYESADV